MWREAEGAFLLLMAYERYDSVPELAELQWSDFGFEDDVADSGQLDLLLHNIVELSDTNDFQTLYQSALYNGLDNKYSNSTDMLLPLEPEFNAHSSFEPPRLAFAQSSLAQSDCESSHHVRNDYNGNNYPNHINNSSPFTLTATAFFKMPCRLTLYFTLHHQNPLGTENTWYTLETLQSYTGPWVIDSHSLVAALKDVHQRDSPHISLSRCSRVHWKYHVKDCFRIGEHGSPMLTDLQNIYQNIHLKGDTYLLDIKDVHNYARAVQDDWQIPPSRQVTICFCHDM